MGSFGLAPHVARKHGIGEVLHKANNALLEIYQMLPELSGSTEFKVSSGSSIELRRGHKLDSQN